MPEAYEVLRMERLLPAPPERVYAAWTRPELLARWFGPEGSTVEDVSLDAQVGGAWRIALRAPDGAVHVAEGRFKTLEPPERILTSWLWEHDDPELHETELEIRLAPEGEGTRLVLLHQRFADQGRHDRHEHGWAGSLDRLERNAEEGAL